MSSSGGPSGEVITTEAQGPLEIKRVRVEDLHHDPANVRLHDRRNIDSIIASIKEFGQVEPLIINKATRKVIGGNGRLTAMKEIGITECDVVEVDLDNISATALGITLNRTASLATWDDDALARTLRALQDEDFDLDAVGFSDAEVDALFAGSEAEQTETLQDDFTAADDNDRFVAFKFGDYSGRVSREVYDSFVAAYQSKQVESGEPMMDDVLRAWLDV